MSVTDIEALKLLFIEETTDSVANRIWRKKSDYCQCCHKYLKLPFPVTDIEAVKLPSMQKTTASVRIGIAAKSIFSDHNYCYYLYTNNYLYR